MKDKKQKIILFLIYYSCIITICTIGFFIYFYTYINNLEKLNYSRTKIGAVLKAEIDFNKGEIHFYRLKEYGTLKSSNDSGLKTKDGYPILYYYHENSSFDKKSAMIFVNAYNKVMKRLITKRKIEQKINKRHGDE